MMQQKTPAWLVREADVPGYHPANHTGTLNRRLIGPDTVGARGVEVLLGVIDKGKGRCRTPTPASSRSVTCFPARPAPRSRTNGPTWGLAIAATSRRTSRMCSPSPATSRRGCW